MKRVIIVLLSIILLSSCAPGVDDSAIVVALSQEPVTMDIMVNPSISGRLVFSGNVYEKLMVMDSHGNPGCELASSCTISDDGRRIEFTLREGVTFHDGSVMDAEDVVLSMNRWLMLSSSASSLVGEGERFYADGDTVVLESSSSLVFLPYLITSSPQSAVIYPKEYVTSSILPENGIPGTGPYMVREWRSGDRIILEKYDGYQSYCDESDGLWGRKEASTALLEYRFVPDSVTRVLGLINGEFDWINDLMSDDRALVASKSGLEIMEGDETGLIALVFNKKDGVMTEKTMRQAVALSLDCDTLMKACYGEYGWSGSHSLMESWQGWEDGSGSFYTRDMERAEKMLSSSSYDGGKVRILTSNLSNLEKIAFAAESALKEVGIDAETLVTDWAGMTEKRGDSTAWDIFVSAYSSVPLPWMKSFLSPHYPGWFNSDGDAAEAVSRLSSSSSLEEAKCMWKETEEILEDYMAAYIAGHYTTAYGASKNLEGVIIQDGFYLWNAKKK